MKIYVLSLMAVWVLGLTFVLFLFVCVFVFRAAFIPFVKCVQKQKWIIKKHTHKNEWIHWQNNNAATYNWQSTKYNNNDQQQKRIQPNQNEPKQIFHVLACIIKRIAHWKFMHYSGWKSFCMMVHIGAAKHWRYDTHNLQPFFFVFE